MGLSQFFGFNVVHERDELPEIFPMPISQIDFVRTDVVTIYSKILTDVIERCHGLTEDQVELLWDNCLKSSSSDGLITLLAKAMTDKKDLFLVYDQAVGVLRVATGSEQQQIRLDYERSAESPLGVYISFHNFRQSDMVKLYSGLEYCTVSSLHKSMNLSKAVQLKFNDLRASVSLSDSAEARSQAKTIAASLAAGKDIMLDGKDSVETSAPNLTATEQSISFIGNKLSFYLNMPASYILGEQTGGIGSSGENDARAVERGLKSYYFSIVKPVLESIFDVTLSYKTQDFRNIISALEVLKTFSLVDEEFLSRENKTKIINQVLDLPEDAEGDIVTAPVQAALQVPPPPVRGSIA